MICSYNTLRFVNVANVVQTFGMQCLNSSTSGLARKNSPSPAVIYRIYRSKTSMSGECGKMEQSVEIRGYGVMAMGKCGDTFSQACNFPATYEFATLPGHPCEIAGDPGYQGMGPECGEISELVRWGQPGINITTGDPCSGPEGLACASLVSKIHQLCVSFCVHESQALS